MNILLMRMGSGTTDEEYELRGIEGGSERYEKVKRSLKGI